MTVNKAALIARVAKNLGSRQAAADAVESVFDAVVRAVADGDRVIITGFGTFEPVAAPARPVRNPMTGERFESPARTVPRFRPHQRFKSYTDGKRAVPAGTSAIRKDPKGSSSTSRRSTA
ncbi:HU family DNA-binding protein [Kitasatospora griseola]